MDAGTLVGLAALGAVLGLDVVSVGQGMLSRPIVAATLAGGVLGQPAAGLLAGATLELVALETLPVGASRYPEWGSAAVVGGALFASNADARAGALALAVLAGMSTAWVGGTSMVALRRLNGQLARASLQPIAAGSGRHVIALQLAGIAADLVRGFALAVVALAVWQPIVRFALARWQTDPQLTRAVTVAMAATVAGGAVWKFVHAVPRARWLFAGGLAIGLLVLAFLP
jgi:PTS system mannose-specific IIC component